MEEWIVKVGGMSCQGCVRNVTGVLVALPGVLDAEVSLEAAEARLRVEPGRLTREALVSAIEDAGFDAR
ncbi:MAG: heavy-metal-associated domain-containing protein [Dechloromonas sp.]|nr:heavy-metal-associated domain-containing protein [Dechloromonas sp.]